jgi:hypothetical protein
MLLRSGSPKHRDVLRAAAAAARDAGDSERLALAAAGMLQYGLMTSGLASDPELIAIAEEALSSLGPQRSAARARVQASLATEIVHSDPDRARALVEEAHEIALELGDPVTVGQVLCTRRVAGHTPGETKPMLDDAASLIEIGHRTADRTFTIAGLQTRAAAHREAGDLVESDRAVAQFEALLGASELPHIQAFLAMLQSSREALGGDLVAAEHDAREILALAKRGGFVPAHWYGSALWAIRHNQDRLARFAPFQRRAGGGLESPLEPLRSGSRQAGAGCPDQRRSAIRRAARASSPHGAMLVIWNTSRSAAPSTAGRRERMRRHPHGGPSPA